MGGLSKKSWKSTNQPLLWDSQAACTWPPPCPNAPTKENQQGNNQTTYGGLLPSGKRLQNYGTYHYFVH